MNTDDRQAGDIEKIISARKILESVKIPADIGIYMSLETYLFLGGTQESWDSIPEDENAI